MNWRRRETCNTPGCTTKRPQVAALSAQEEQRLAALRKQQYRKVDAAAQLVQAGGGTAPERQDRRKCPKCPFNGNRESKGKGKLRAQCSRCRKATRVIEKHHEQQQPQQRSAVDQRAGGSRQHPAREAAVPHEVDAPYIRSSQARSLAIILLFRYTV